MTNMQKTLAYVFWILLFGAGLYILGDRALDDTNKFREDHKKAGYCTCADHEAR